MSKGAEELGFGLTLSDFITIEMMDNWGTMKLSSITHALQNRGISTSPDAVYLALSRNPTRFKPLGNGLYELGPLGPLTRKRQGRKLRETQK